MNMESTIETTTRETGELYVPSHGHGKLRNGGTNKGGPGRPPEAWREELKSRCSIERIDELFADAKTVGNLALQFKLIEFCAAYGFGEPKQSVEHSIDYGARVIRLPAKKPIGDGALPVSSAQA